MRGSHEGSFEVAHAIRDGEEFAAATPDNEKYDLIIVGGGLSGLAAAYFYRKQSGANARVLIIENHDDFGGHAKRNEFQSGDRFLIGYGGTQAIAAPKTYSAESMALLREVGVEVDRFDRYFEAKFFQSRGLSRGVFFSKEVFGSDRLVPGVGKPSWPEFLAKTPLSVDAQKDIARLQAAKVDYLPGMNREQKKEHLARTSFKDFLLKDVKVHPDVIPYFQTSTYGLYGVGIDAVPAGDVAFLGAAGFSGMDLSGPPGPGLGYEVTKQDFSAPYIYHFPDGNASLARLLVRALIPGSAPGHTMEDIVLARMDYSKLDDAASPVRIRLNSTAIHAKNIGDPATSREVEVTYVRGGKVHSVRAGACVLACWNTVIPYICPEMSDKQKEALAYGVKIPLVYTNVAIRNWTSFDKLRISAADCPGSFFSDVALDFPVSMGNYKYPTHPEEPCVLHLEYVPCKPGLAGARAATRGTVRSAANKVRDIREKCPRSTWPHAFERRLRSCPRYSGNHRESLAARLRLRIQLALRSGFCARSTAVRDRPASLRPDPHRKLGCRSVCLYKCGVRSGVSSGEGNYGEFRVKRST